MELSILPAFNVQIWVGLREQYDETSIASIKDVYKICDEFVNSTKDCVTVTPTNFRYVAGNEPGVIVGFISYPRFKRSKKEIIQRALSLGELLMISLKQYRITITTPKKSIMLTNTLLTHES